MDGEGGGAHEPEVGAFVWVAGWGVSEGVIDGESGEKRWNERCVQCRGLGEVHEWDVDVVEDAESYCS